MRNGGGIGRCVQDEDVCVSKSGTGQSVKDDDACVAGVLRDV